LEKIIDTVISVDDLYIDPLIYFPRTNCKSVKATPHAALQMFPMDFLVVDDSP